MLAVIAEFVVKPGAEREFEDALAVMQDRVTKFVGYLREKP